MGAVTSKYSIALKEARETRYWLRLILASECLSSEDIAINGIEQMIDEVEELMNIIAAIIIATKRRQK